MDSYQIGDRRPLASRGWKISERIARWLARRGITPNAISIAGMLCGIAAGIMFFETSRFASVDFLAERSRSRPTATAGQPLRLHGRRSASDCVTSRRALQ